MFLSLVFVAGAFTAWAFNELALISWRRSAQEHWTEQARRLYPARISRHINLWGLPIGLTLLTRIFHPGTSWPLVALCGFFGVLLGNFPMDRITNPGLTFREWSHEVLAGWLLKLSSWATFGLAAYLMPINPGWSMGAVIGGFFLVYMALQFGISIRMMHWLHLLKPASPRLVSLVSETSSTMGVTVRNTWEMAVASANAFAFVTTRDLVFTQKLVAACPDEEIQAVCAHELGHLSESRLTLTGRIVGALILFPFIFVRPVYAQWEVSGLVLLGIAAALIWVGNIRLSKAMEKRADRIATESIEEKIAYAKALERLYRMNRMPAVQPKESTRTHPDLYDRMLAAGLTPEYPKPAAPSKQCWPSIVTTTVVSFLIIYQVILLGK